MQAPGSSQVPIFFAGDVQPDRPLMHEAADEGQMAAQAALSSLRGESWPGASRRVPITILFTDPDACAVGMTHGAAMQEGARSEEHTSELQSLMRISYAVFCLKKKKKNV